jgi:predicted DNA-binding ribbon-helix-helix protein
MKLKRSVILNGHKTSVSLEDAFWVELKAIAKERKVGLGELIATVDADRKQANLSSALRLFVLAKYRPEAVGIDPPRSSRSGRRLADHPQHDPDQSSPE